MNPFDTKIVSSYLKLIRFPLQKIRNATGSRLTILLVLTLNTYILTHCTTVDSFIY